MGMPPPPPGGRPPPPPGSGGPPGYPSSGPPPGYPPGAPPPSGYVPFGVGPVSRSNGLAVASMVLGIIGVLTFFLLIPWILAIIFGLVALKQCNDDPYYTNRGLAIAGLVLGLVSLGLIVLVFALGSVDYTVT